MRRILQYLLINTIMIHVANAQSLPDSILINAYNQVLSDRYNPTASGKQKMYAEFFVADNLSALNREHFEVVQLKDCYAGCNRLFISRKPFRLYHLSHENFHNSADTVDVNVQESTFRCVNRKQVEIMVSCNGDMGYIPAARLVFDRNSKTWALISFDTLYNAVLDRERNRQQQRKSKSR